MFPSVSSEGRFEFGRGGKVPIPERGHLRGFRKKKIFEKFFDFGLLGLK
jgi:hypothetical protein